MLLLRSALAGLNAIDATMCVPWSRLKGKIDEVA